MNWDAALHALGWTLGMLAGLVLVPVFAYFIAKAARIGWLRGEEIFIGRKLKRTFKDEDFPDDET